VLTPAEATLHGDRGQARALWTLCARNRPSPSDLRHMESRRRPTPGRRPEEPDFSQQNEKSL